MEEIIQTKTFDITINGSTSWTPKTGIQHHPNLVVLGNKGEGWVVKFSGVDDEGTNRELTEVTISYKGVCLVTTIEEIFKEMKR